MSLKPENPIPQLGLRSLRISLWGVLAITAGYYVFLAWKVIVIPHPVTFDEPGFIDLTTAPDPYREQNLVSCGNVYGPGSPLWMRIFLGLPLNTYTAHRLGATTALLLALLLLGYIIRRGGTTVTVLMAVLVIVFALNASSHSLAANADFVAMLLYIVALAGASRGTRIGLAVSIAAGVAAGLCKAYAALPLLTVGSYLVMTRRWRAALYYCLGCALAVSVLALLFVRDLSGYWISTVVVHSMAATRSWDWLWHQTTEFAALTCALVASFLFGLRRIGTSLGAWFTRGEIDFWDWAALIAAVALLGSMGWHTGNFLVYYYQLLLPPLAVGAAQRLQRHLVPAYILCAANLLILFYFSPAIPGPDNWGRLQADILATPGPVLADSLFQPLAGEKGNLSFFEHGQTVSIRQALDKMTPTAGTAAAHIKLLLQADLPVQLERISHAEFSAIYITYINVDGGSLWIYDRGKILPTLARYYRAVSSDTISLYYASYWSRLAHGKHELYVVKWVPRTQIKAL